jgi:hypothetical protein
VAASVAVLAVSGGRSNDPQRSTAGPTARDRREEGEAWLQFGQGDRKGGAHREGGGAASKSDGVGGALVSWSICEAEGRARGGCSHGR